jgi:hypothetical protein
MVLNQLAMENPNLDLTKLDRLPPLEVLQALLNTLEPYGS